MRWSTPAQGEPLLAVLMSMVVALNDQAPDDGRVKGSSASSDRDTQRQTCTSDFTPGRPNSRGVYSYDLVPYLSTLRHAVCNFEGLPCSENDLQNWRRVSTPRS